ncbi:MAG: efflux RND transporter periplasmic adaptor subunit [Candidatus Obscuribacterales bacterium]
MDPNILNAQSGNPMTGGFRAPSAEDAVEPPVDNPHRTKILIIAVTAGAFLTLLLFGALPRIMQQQDLLHHSHSQLAQNPSVAFVVAQSSPAVEEFTLPGSTEAIQEASIYARVNGYLHKRYVNIGDHVRAGQILADIDTPELDQQVQQAASAAEQAAANVDNAREALKKSQADAISAEANVRKGRTDLQFQNAQVKRYTQLAGEGAVSLEDRDSHVQAYNAALATLDSLVQAHKAAAANVDSSKASVHVAEAASNAAKASLQQIQATRSFKSVTALFDGIVTQRNVDAGALITAGSATNNQVLFNIAKTDVLRVFVYSPEEYVTHMHVGDKALLSFQEYPARDFVGEVSHVAGGLNTDSKTLQVEIHVPNSDHKLMPGMYAKVRFQSPSEVRLPIVPATTVQTRAEGSFIYTVDADNKVRMHKVEVARDLGGQLEIARGLTIGDRVIVNPADDIQNGAQVTPVAATQQK